MPFSSLENLTKIRHAQGQTHPHGRSAHAKHHGCLPPPEQTPAAPPTSGTPDPEPAKARNISGTTRANRWLTPPRPRTGDQNLFTMSKTSKHPRASKPGTSEGRPGGTTRAARANPILTPSAGDRAVTAVTAESSASPDPTKDHRAVFPSAPRFAPAPASARGLHPRPTRLETRLATRLGDRTTDPARKAGKPESRPWWSRTESNRRPPACKAGALPTELRPLFRRVPARLGVPVKLCRHLVRQLGGAFTGAVLRPWPGVVGLGRLELPTSRLSGVRSNRLSYRPPPPASPLSRPAERAAGLPARPRPRPQARPEATLTGRGPRDGPGEDPDGMPVRAPGSLRITPVGPPVSRVSVFVRKG